MSKEFGTFKEIALSFGYRNVGYFRRVYGERFSVVGRIKNAQGMPTLALEKHALWYVGSQFVNTDFPEYTITYFKGYSVTFERVSGDAFKVSRCELYGTQYQVNGLTFAPMREVN